MLRNSLKFGNNIEFQAYSRTKIFIVKEVILAHVLCKTEALKCHEKIIGFGGLDNLVGVIITPKLSTTKLTLDGEDLTFI